MFSKLYSYNNTDIIMTTLTKKKMSSEELVSKLPYYKHN
jgi:hypothetical protein